MTRRRWIALGGAVLAVVVLAPLGLQVKKAAAQDPNFCLSCHQMDGPYLNWANSAHADVTCVRCHPGDLMTDLKHGWLGLVKQQQEVLSKAEVDESACLGCHVEGGDPEWPAIAATIGHRVHAEREELDCVSCHGSDLHVERPASEVCAECHAESLTLSGMVGQAHCLDCHNFLGDADSLEPTAEACRGCHAADEAGGAHAVEAHGTLDCLGCHAPHEVVPTSAEPCAECHEQEMANHAPENASCTDCHAPHEPAHGAGKACADCHERPAHGGHLACTDCHSPHDSEAPDRACADCHDQRKGLHGLAPHQDCTTCHRPHRLAKPEDAQCIACHEAVLDGHATMGCIGCHTFRKDLPDHSG